MEGTIKTLVTEKQYGFVRGADGVEYFFHKSGLEATTEAFEALGVGQRVAFTPVAGPKGPRAVEVRVL